MTVRMGEGAAKALLAIFCRGERHSGLIHQTPSEHKILCTNTICSYAEFRVAALKEKPVWSHPVAVDDVRLPVAVEVGERDSSPVLLAVLHTLTTFMKEIFSC